MIFFGRHQDSWEVSILPAIRSDLINRRHHVRIRQAILVSSRAVHFGDEKVETSAQNEVKVDPDPNAPSDPLAD